MGEKKTTDQPKKLGRPKKIDVTGEQIVDEKNQDHLDMARKEEDITIDELTKKWSRTFDNIMKMENSGANGRGISTVTEKWNKLNPFLQNQRVKNIYTQAKKYEKADIGKFLSSPANYEQELRSLSWANSSSQQIYYNILRRAGDIPLYNYYVVPDLLDAANYKKDDFVNEDALVQDWLEVFNVKNTLKTIALEVKREGKSSYLLRNKFIGQGKGKKTSFATFQKLPTEWTKITGKGSLGFTVSFNMMYFLNIANSPEDFGDFMVSAWNAMVDNGIVEENKKSMTRSINIDNIGKAKNFSVTYNDKQYGLSIESVKNGSAQTFLMWLRMPYDICYTIGSDNSHPWATPDTMGLMLKLQELTDYGQLAGLIASTPLTAVLTGEIETIQQPRAGKNESVFSPEVIQGMVDRFNAVTSTNVEAWMWPAKNIKLQQLASDVNSSDIINTATENFIESAGEGGLTIMDTKPNVAQVVVAKQLAAAQQHYVTLQMENILNFILQNKLGFKYKWTIKLWGDVFNIMDERKYLKEVVANGNIGLFPKLMSAEGISMRDTKSITEYIKSLDFYKDFSTYTQIKAAELSQEAADVAAEQATEGQSGAGRPEISENDIVNDATAASREAGTNTSENRI